MEIRMAGRHLLLFLIVMCLLAPSLPSWLDGKDGDEEWDLETLKTDAKLAERMRKECRGELEQISEELVQCKAESDEKGIRVGKLAKELQELLVTENAKHAKIIQLQDDVIKVKDECEKKLDAKTTEITQGPSTSELFLTVGASVLLVNILTILTVLSIPGVGHFLAQYLAMYDRHTDRRQENGGQKTQDLSQFLEKADDKEEDVYSEDEDKVPCGEHDGGGMRAKGNKANTGVNKRTSTSGLKPGDSS